MAVMRPWKALSKAALLIHVYSGMRGYNGEHMHMSVR